MFGVDLSLSRQWEGRYILVHRPIAMLEVIAPWMCVTPHVPLKRFLNPFDLSHIFVFGTICFAVEMRNPEDRVKHHSHVFPLSTEITSSMSMFFMSNYKHNRIFCDNISTDTHAFFFKIPFHAWRSLWNVKYWAFEDRQKKKKQKKGCMFHNSGLSKYCLSTDFLHIVDDC